MTTLKTMSGVMLIQRFIWAPEPNTGKIAIKPSPSEAAIGIPPSQALPKHLANILRESHPCSPGDLSRCGGRSVLGRAGAVVRGQKYGMHIAGTELKGPGVDLPARIDAESENQLQAGIGRNQGVEIS